MIVLLGIVVLFLIYYEIFILNRFDIRKMDIEDILCKYESNLDTIIKQVIEEIDYSNIHSQEDLYCYIIDKSLDSLEDFLLREDLKETEYKILEDTEKVKDYISSKLSDVDIDVLYQRTLYQYTHKENENNIDLSTERVSNNIKSDEPTVDILNEVNNIFFE